jgi:hypothetical protein
MEKGLKRSSIGIVELISRYRLKGLRKTLKTSVKTAGIAAEIRVECLQNKFRIDGV